MAKPKVAKAPASHPAKAAREERERTARGLWSSALRAGGAVGAVAVAAALYQYATAVPASQSGDEGTSAPEKLIGIAYRDKKTRVRVTSEIFPGTGRGVAAAMDFDVGDVVMELPLDMEAYFIGKHSLPATFAAHDAQFPAMDDDLQHKRDLALGLLYERQLVDTGAKRRWAPFYSMLPVSFTNYAGMNEVHRRALNDTAAGRKFDELAEVVDAAIGFVESARGLFSSVPSAADIRWACAIATERAHRFARTKNRFVQPFLQMANHHHDPKQACEFETVTVGSTKVLQLKTRKKIRLGEEVFVHYGRYPNTMLLVSYGFTVPQNRVLEPTPIRFMQTLGPAVFRFGNDLPSPAPKCLYLMQNVAEELQRTMDLEAGLPELLVKCHRMGKFEDVESVMVAVKAGMFDDEGEAHFKSVELLAPAWMERDVVAYQEIAAACTAELNLIRSDSLVELKALGDSVSMQLHMSLRQETEGWRKCVSVMGHREARARAVACVAAGGGMECAALG